MEFSEVRQVLIDACPEEATPYGWSDQDASGTGLAYVEMGVVARYLGARLRAGETASFPALFAAIERCLLEGATTRSSSSWWD